MHSSTKCYLYDIIEEKYQQTNSESNIKVVKNQNILTLQRYKSYLVQTFPFEDEEIMSH